MEQAEPKGKTHVWAAPRSGQQDTAKPHADGSTEHGEARFYHCVAGRIGRKTAPTGKSELCPKKTQGQAR